MGYDGGKSGISSYMRAAVENLKSSGHNLTLIVENDAAEDFEGFKKIVVPAVFSKSAAAMLWHIFALPFYTRNKFYDCLLVLAANRRYAPFCKLPKVGVVHDLSQYRVGKKYDALRMFYLTKVQPYLGRTFDVLAAISESTKIDVEKFWKVPAKKISIAYNGLNTLASPDEAILTRLNLNKYILYVSRIEHPGKNHSRLIEAFEKLPDEIKKDYKLVFAGSDWTNAEIVRAQAATSSCAERIVFTGFVSDAELASLYKNASAFVMPSLSEGFGLPLIEAMSCGVPCACSNTSALAEIGKDCALLFNPESPEEIEQAIFKLLSDESLRATLAQKGKLRSKDFDWQKHAKILVSICENLYRKNSQLKIFDIPFRNGRMDEVANEISDFAQTHTRKTVAFLNTHYLNTAYEDPSQVERLKKFDYVLPDGSGVSLACKILGYRYRDNLNGTDLLPQLCTRALSKNLSMYFFGGKEGVASRAAVNLLKEYPNLKIVGTRNGYFTKEQEPEIIEKINAANPDFLFVGFGAKIQEEWVLRNADKLNAPIILAVGGLCDVYSGDLFRVPPFMRKMGLEWLGRLYQDPIRLFRRYVFGNPLFLSRVVKYRFVKKS